MIDVLDSLGPQENWCSKYYHAGTFFSIDTPLWGIRSSAMDGLVAHQAVPLKSSQPYDGLWRFCYNELVCRVERLGLDKFGLDSQEDLIRRIEILCNRNRYPANSVAHIYVWRENSSSGGITDFAIYQCKCPHRVYDDDGQKHIILNASVNEVVNLAVDSWTDVAVEAIARQKVEHKSRVDAFDYFGMVLNRPDGKIARTTSGNIYFTCGRNIIGVKEGEGAKSDALHSFLKQAIDELNAESQGRLPISYTEMDGIDDATLKSAGGCFVCDSAVGVVPILSLIHI